jgi:hypothetical protein
MDANLEHLISQLDDRISSGAYDHVHGKWYGIRSRQVAAVLELLIELFPEKFSGEDHGHNPT